MTRRQIFTTGHRALFCALSCALAIACTGGDLEEHNAIAERLAPILVDNVRTRPGGDIAGLHDDAERLGPVAVYVDRSLTMQPYVRTPGTAFGRLVGILDDFIASEVSFFGFGFPTREGSSQKVEPLPPHEIYQDGTYTYANNDYAALFRAFPRDGTTRLVITDAVQSDPEGGARLRAVAEELHRWVTDGGAFAALVYRNPYHGQYYSDLTEADPIYSCGNRPLVAFVLAPSRAAVADLLTRLGPGLNPAHVIQVGGTDLSINLVPETLPDSSRRRGVRVASGIDTAVAAGFHPIPFSVVLERSGDGFEGYVPLQVEAVLSLRQRPWATLGREGTVEFVRHLRPSLHAWSFDKRALRGASQPAKHGASNSLGAEPVKLDVRTPPPPEVRVSGDSVRARFTLPTRRPGAGGKDFALLVSLRPDENGARALVPDELSTDDDRDPGACGRVLKLQRLLSGILLRNYVPGRTLLVTDWR